MDFGDLLHMAQKNSQHERRSESKYYSTKFAPPKKETKDKKLSSNIQKFLAKREEEEREALKVARQKKEELLAMRDTKAKNKINKMLKTIKSANKSVLDDAVDHQNTAVTLQGPDQPDEDDYGYVSQEASALYSKMMEKYKAMPDEKKFDFSRKALSKDEMKSTKDRVKAAIVREQEEENQPHRRQRQSKSSTEVSSTDRHDRPTLAYRDDPEPVREAPKVFKKRPPPPPAMDFQQLMKLAEQKQFEPIALDTTKAIKEPERLMTNKEKKEMEERRAFMEAMQKRRKERENGGQPSTPPTTKMEPNGRIPKLNGGSSAPKDGRIPKLNTPASGGSQKPPLKQSHHKSSNDVNQNSDGGKTNKLYNALTKPSNSSQKPKSATSSSSSSSSSASTSHNQRNSGALEKSAERPKAPAMRTPTEKAQPSKLKSNGPTTLKPSSTSSSSSSSSSSVIKSKPSRAMPEKTREFPPRDTIKKPLSASEVKPRQFPPADVKTRKFPPDDVRRSGGPSAGNKSKKPVAVKRRIMDSDEEEDSELDDFIDDGPEDETENYSKYIRDIFGYDKNRFRDEDFDDRQMESTFAQQMREEFVSKKIGLMEDLEDMRQEALEKQQKTQFKKRKK